MVKLIDKIKRKIKLVACKLIGYKVVVEWEGKVVVHWSLTLVDAMDWMLCYNGVGARVTIEGV